jgi:uncharacterized protein (DUF427 family)
MPEKNLTGERKEISRRDMLGVIGGAATAAPLLLASAQAQSVGKAALADDDDLLFEAPAPSRFSSQPVRIEMSPKWVRVQFGGQIVASSKRVLLVSDNGRTPVYYFPKQDVRMDLLTPGKRRSRSDSKGEAEFFTLKAGDKVGEEVVWNYPRPETADPKLGKAPDLRNYVSFEWAAMDAWYEEGEEVFVHPHDPYHRIDTLLSSRHVKVVVGGQVVAETRRPVLLFETGFVTRYYIPKEDVRMDLLRPSNTITKCAYKGEARYYSAEVGGKTYKDIVWYYRFPTTEVSRIANGLSFYTEQVDALYVDGEDVSKQPRPRG